MVFSSKPLLRECRTFELPQRGQSRVLDITLNSNDKCIIRSKGVQ
jgi:hypothetical protein